jgi:hypothetical protein
MKKTRKTRLVKKAVATLVSGILTALVLWGVFSFVEIATKNPLDTNREFSEYNLIVMLMNE